MNLARTTTSPFAIRLRKLLTLSPCDTLPASEANKSRHPFREGAHSNGTIVFRGTPIGSDALCVEAAIANGTSGNTVAHAVVDAFRL